MKRIIFPLLFSALFAQEIPKPLEKEAAISMHTSDRSVIVIDPKSRAKDFVQAYKILKKEKPTFRVMVATQTGVLENVMDLSTSEGGTLLLIKMLSNQGTRMHIVPVEQMLEIGYSP